MLFVLILAIALTSCVMCERNALGLGARTNEDIEQLDHSRRWLVALFKGAVLGYQGGRATGWWKRGGADGRMERFKVMIQANPCAFNIYDANGDGAITWEEFEAIFGEGETTHKLAEALDESGDGMVDEKEFKKDMHKFVEGC
ncbi:uncharacterized protein LOC127876671 [Dreissena polymorpha]|uniref:EF-hand domain-containing protein n=1 Tax=Dreissena polymorpha TaxID=45954 RepID=A0A9D4KIU6_DREPO|nr:uncharacterized protein LOC127876670 [Dreissena polymorpha]XP_052277998.1 uncharacterized protein LOC127876671 [Dreissena polymorpha]KAH3840333.1 hypothetical protein DPMN_113780 [Dreissena polymorpha]